MPHALRNDHLVLPALCHWHRLRTYAPSKPTGCFPGGLNAVFFIPLPFLACDMQSPGSKWHAATAPPAKWARWSGTAGRPGRRSSTGWCLCGTMARFFHRAPAFSGQMGRLSRNPNWPQDTTHKPRADPRNSPPTRPLSPATPHHALAELAGSPFCRSQWGPLCIPGVSLSSAELKVLSVLV